MAIEQERTLWGRRDLLTRGGLWGLSAALLCGAGVLLRSLWPRAGRASSMALTIGRPTDFTVGRISELFFKEHQIWIYRDEEGFTATFARCTHLGCKLQYTAGADHYQCNCHGSSFGLDGSVRRGPAARPLERVFIALTASGSLQVDPSIRYRQERGEWSQPGAFVRYAGRPSTGVKKP